MQSCVISDRVISGAHPLAPIVDLFMCSFDGIECIDLDWTYNLTARDFVDKAHFTAKVYTRINQQIMSSLQNTTFDYAKRKILMPVERFGQIIHQTKDNYYFVDNFGFLRKFSYSFAGGDISIISNKSNESQQTSSSSSSSSCIEAFSIMSSTNGDRHYYEMDVLEMIKFAKGPFIKFTCPEKKLIKSSSSGSKAIYLMENSTRRKFSTFQAFVNRGFDISMIEIVDEWEFLNIKQGTDIKS